MLICIDNKNFSDKIKSLKKGVNMKKFFLFLIATFAIIFYAETSDEILKKIEAKYSSYSDIKSIDAIYKSIFYNNDVKVPMTMKIFVKDKKMKLEIIPDSSEINEVQQMATTIINDGENIFLVNPIVGKIKLSEEEKSNYNQDKGVLWWKQLNDEYDYLYEKDNSYIFQHKKTKALLFIGKENLFPSKYIDYQNDEKDTVIMTFSDYKIVDKERYMPFKIEANSKGKKIMEMNIDKIKFNTQIDDSLFEVKTGKATDINDLLKKFSQ